MKIYNKHNLPFRGIFILILSSIFIWIALAGFIYFFLDILTGLLFALLTLILVGGTLLTIYMLKGFFHLYRVLISIPSSYIIRIESFFEAGRWEPTPGKKYMLVGESLTDCLDRIESKGPLSNDTWYREEIFSKNAELSLEYGRKLSFRGYEGFVTPPFFLLCWPEDWVHPDIKERKCNERAFNEGTHIKKMINDEEDGFLLDTY